MCGRDLQVKHLHDNIFTFPLCLFFTRLTESKRAHLVPWMHSFVSVKMLRLYGGSRSNSRPWSRSVRLRGDDIGPLVWAHHRGASVGLDSSDNRVAVNRRLRPSALNNELCFCQVAPPCVIYLYVPAAFLQWGGIKQIHPSTRNAVRRAKHGQHGGVY